MHKFLILLSDQAGVGDSIRGNLLRDFLRTWYSPEDVQTITIGELEKCRSLHAETLFICLPNSLRRTHLKRIKFDRAILLDYHDSGQPIWGGSDKQLLLSLTDCYLRCYRTLSLTDAAHNPDGLRFGLLPIYRKPNLQRCVAARRFWRKSLRAKIYPRHDVSFLGAPTEITLAKDGVEEIYNQRVDWLREIKASPIGNRFWGGLACSGQVRRVLPEIEDRCGDLSDLMFAKRRTSFFRFFTEMCRSRVVIAPAGYSRWSFRHYEALYSGAAVVSTDMSDIEMLIPFPEQNMFFVKDHAPVLPTIQRAIQEHHDDRERFESNIDFLEQYLQNGGYSRVKPQLLENFLQQLPVSVNQAKSNRIAA